MGGVDIYHEVLSELKKMANCDDIETSSIHYKPLKLFLAAYNIINHDLLTTLYVWGIQNFNKF